MKRFIQIIIINIILFSGLVQAQFTITLNIANPAPVYFSDWAFPRSGMAIIVYNPADKLPVVVKFRTQILNSDNNSILASSIDASAVTHTLNPGPNNLTLDKILQINNLEIKAGEFRNSLTQHGKFPSGNYQLCIQLISSRGVELLKSPVCRQFVQPVYQLPYLLSPADKTWLDANVAQSVITFRWSSIVPQPKERMHYRLQVFEVLANQQPMQALRSNQPILNMDVMAVTQYIWRPQLSLKDSEGRIFIWTVQTLDAKGYPFSTPDAASQGRSEPFVFGVCDNPVEKRIEFSGNGKMFK